MKLFFLIMITAFWGCSDISGFNSGTSGSSKDRPANDDKDEDGAELASEPVEITGAFLYCAFMDNDAEIKQKAERSESFGSGSAAAEANALEVGCGLYNKKSLRKTSGDGLILSWDVMNKNKGQSLSNTPQEFNRPFNAIMRVPVEKATGSMVAKIRSKETGEAGYRILDIADISYTGANNGINLNKELDAYRKRLSSGNFKKDNQIDQSAEPKSFFERLASNLGPVSQFLMPNMTDEYKQKIASNTNRALHYPDTIYKERPQGGIMGILSHRSPSNNDSLSSSKGNSILNDILDIDPPPR